MTITEALKDANSQSGSITDAIDKLALAMGGGFRSASTRQNTDATGRIVQQTLFNSDGTAVSVKRAERNTGGGEKIGTGGGTAITYDGTYWVMNGTYGAHQLDLFFEAEDDEKIVIRITANGIEATAGDEIIISNSSLGGETAYLISSSDDYTFVGFPGQSYRVSLQTGGGGGDSNGTLIVDYMPELAPALNDQFVFGFPSIPSAFIDAIPKLLPRGRSATTGGGIAYETAITWQFPNGLRPWFGGSTTVRDVALIVKFIGGVSFPIAELGIPAELYLRRWEGGVSYGIAISDEGASQTSSGFWPAYVAYFNVDDEVFGYTPVDITLVITHGVSTVIPQNSPTLGYFIVRGAD